MVGDNIDTDIKGAESSGIEAILYDYKDKYRDYPGARITDLLLIIPDYSSNLE